MNGLKGFIISPKHKVGSYLFAVSWMAHMLAKQAMTTNNMAPFDVGRLKCRSNLRHPQDDSIDNCQPPHTCKNRSFAYLIVVLFFFLFYPPFLSFFMKKKKFNVSRCFKNFRVLITETTKFHYILLRPKDIYFLFFPLPLSNPFGFVAKWNCDFPFL